MFFSGCFDPEYISQDNENKNNIRADLIDISAYKEPLLPGRIAIGISLNNVRPRKSLGSPYLNGTH